MIHLCAPLYRAVTMNIGCLLIKCTLLLSMPYLIPVDICYLIFELVKKYHTVPGWNEYVKEAHSEA